MRMVYFVLKVGSEEGERWVSHSLAAGLLCSFAPLLALLDLVPLRQRIHTSTRSKDFSISFRFVVLLLSLSPPPSSPSFLVNQAQLRAAMPPPKRDSDHYAHYKANRHILSSTALLQRRRNLRAAIEVLTLLFLGTADAPEPEIPLRDQNCSFMFRAAGIIGAATLHTSQQAAADLVVEFEGVLATVTDDQAGNEEWLKENSETAYAQYRVCENRFNAVSNYAKYERRLRGFRSPFLSFQD